VGTFSVELNLVASIIVPRVPRTCFWDRIVYAKRVGWRLPRR